MEMKKIIYCIVDELVYVVTEEWWNEEGCLCDGGEEYDLVDNAMSRAGFCEAEESVFYMEGSQDEMIAKLSEQGFEMVKDKNFEMFVLE